MIERCVRKHRTATSRQSIDMRRARRTQQIDREDGIRGTAFATYAVFE